MLKKLGFVSKLISPLLLLQNQKNNKNRWLNSSKILASNYFSSTKTLVPQRPQNDPVFDELYGRVMRIREPRASIAGVLDQWLREGNSVKKHHFQYLVYLLKHFRRFNHALQISTWMMDRCYFPLSPSDAMSRVELIGAVHGMSQAENYFKKLSNKLKTPKVYNALLRGYVRDDLVQKAEELMQDMRVKGMVTSSFPYNILLTHYSRTADLDKIKLLIKEMEKNSIPADKYTMRNLMNAYISASDISGMERIFNQIEIQENPSLSLDWKVYSLAAIGYLKVGDVGRALKMLKKIEELIPIRGNNKTFSYLLSLYSKSGKKDEVLRVWNKYKSSKEPASVIYATMIQALSEFSDIEGAEKVFQEWESNCDMYDFRVLNRLLGVYFRNGAVDKAETALKNAVDQGRIPYQNTWMVMAVGYVELNQMSKAVEMLKQAIMTAGRGWKLNPDILKACLDYLEGQGDAKAMGEILMLLKNL